MNRYATLLVGCASIGTALSCASILGIKDVPDAAPDDASSDVVDGGAMCDPLAPFDGTPTAVLGLPSTGIDGINLAPDELTAYVLQFAPNPNTPFILSFATRTSTTGSFGSATVIANDLGVASVTTTTNNLTLVWQRYDSEWDGGAVPASHLYWGTRSSATNPIDFDGGTRIVGQDGGSELVPFLRGDGTELYFVSDNAALQGSVYVSEKDAGFQNGTPVTSVPTTANDPVVTSDGLVIYFLAAGPNDDMQVAIRASTAVGFGVAQSISLPDAGLGATNKPVLITDDRCTFYYETVTESVANDGSLGLATKLYVLHKTPQ